MTQSQVVAKKQWPQTFTWLHRNLRTWAGNWIADNSRFPVIISRHRSMTDGLADWLTDWLTRWLLNEWQTYWMTEWLTDWVTNTTTMPNCKQLTFITLYRYVFHFCVIDKEWTNDVTPTRHDVLSINRCSALIMRIVKNYWRKRFSRIIVVKSVSLMQWRS